MIVTYELIGDALHAFVHRQGQLRHRRLAVTIETLREEVGELETQWTLFRVGPSFVLRTATC